jgi:formate-dependent nitrite reductase cytochrome c552 subunit
MNEMGPAGFYKGTWEEKGAEIVNPIGCGDCHDAKTMNLHISRPALVEAKTAWDNGATDAMMKEALTDIRHAQWRWDYAAASHGASFHSPVEVSRVIASGISIAQEARIKLARVLATLGHNQPVPYPDISSKAKAQAFIGLDIEQLNADKKRFIDEVVPEWDKEAKEREQGYVYETSPELSGRVTYDSN